MIKEAIVKIVSKEDLSYDEAYTVMNEIMNGETTATQNAAFLAALSTKSAKAETKDEIAGCAAAMRDHATKVVTDLPVIEIVGTGGDKAGSFNISTTSALVTAAGGGKAGRQFFRHAGAGAEQREGRPRRDGVLCAHDRPAPTVERHCPADGLLRSYRDQISDRELPFRQNFQHSRADQPGGTYNGNFHNYSKISFNNPEAVMRAPAPAPWMTSGEA